MRTDLAEETHEYLLKENKGGIDGITFEERKEDGFIISQMNILDEHGEKATGKSEGKYTTITFGKIEKLTSEEELIIAKKLSDTLKEYIPRPIPPILVAGLGNREITADSIGPKVVDSIIVTRHLQQSDPVLFDSLNFSEVSAIAPGVLGQTGIESAEIIKSLVKSENIGLVIAIDSLAAMKISRLASTIQVTDAGIAPGSGVQNNRPALNEKTVGIPIISIGMPTVVDALTLACDISQTLLSNVNTEKLREKVIGKDMDFFVTPKEADTLTDTASHIIALGINLALHRSLNEKEALTLMA